MYTTGNHVADGYYNPNDDKIEYIKCDSCEDEHDTDVVAKIPSTGENICHKCLSANYMLKLMEDINGGNVEVMEIFQEAYAIREKLKIVAGYEFKLTAKKIK